jgi:hypothetical protein
MHRVPKITRLGAFLGVCVALAVGLATRASGQASVPGAPWSAPVAGAENSLGRMGLANNGPAPTSEARLRLWVGARRMLITRRIGAHTYVHGRLTSRIDRHGIARAGIIIAREIADKPGWTVVGLVATNKHGSFRYRVPKGPSRRFGAIYWPHSVSVEPVYSRSVTIRSSARVTLRARSGRHGIVRFSGRVTGAAIPPVGLLVNVQVANRGLWPSVRTVHTMPTGRFSGRYRFCARRPEGFLMRAEVLRQTGWRLFGGRSRRVRVHPR